MLEELHGDIIYPDALEQRIEALKKSLPDYDGQHIVPDDFFNEDERDEYEALTTFRDDVTQWCGAAWKDSPGYIAESYFGRYAYDRACDLYSKEFVESGYFNDEAWEDDEREKFQEIDLDGVTYLIDKS